MCHCSSFTLPLLSAAKFSEFGAQCLYTSNIPPCVIIHIRHSSTHTINKTYFNRKPSLALVGIVLLNIGCGVGIFKSLMHWCALMSVHANHYNLWKWMSDSNRNVSIYNFYAAPIIVNVSLLTSNFTKWATGWWLNPFVAKISYISFPHLLIKHWLLKNEVVCKYRQTEERRSCTTLI